MKISPARAAAYEVLLRVDRDAAFATEALDARLVGVEKRADAALATELTLGILRWQRLLDFLLARYTRHEVASLDPEVRLALRLGLYQMRFLSRIPAAAAVNDSVELVKRARKSSAAGMVNAMLRRAARDTHLRAQADSLVPPDLPLAERLGIALSHPTWLVERWLARFGESATRALLEADNRPPRLTVALLDPDRAGDVRAALAEQGIEVAPGRWLAAAVVLRASARGGSRRPHGALLHPGMLVQDEASQMIPLLAGVQPGDRVLDLCAAPGGKTARLARQSSPGILVAADIHLHRLRQMRELLGRTGARNVHPVVLDGTQPLPFSARFNHVLVDAPCSGTGTLARNPEIRWRLRPGDLAALAEKQNALARHGLAQLAPGGRLVYSTCSLEPEENEQVVAELLARCGARLVSAEAHLASYLRPGSPAGMLFDAHGYFRTMPSRDATDGFFAAVIELAGARAR
jgi:16S rRNA (cytosine967-C5)-methyltransferase